ncbi:MAG: phosphoribosylaminoimidazolesuccinocarboxamide synthase [Thermoanaerobaculia bacterium]|nr:phosphoribosylaminoimidazolesuccinocarboxamide synthase [Thermoanaerobaculia bacterium]
MSILTEGKTKTIRSGDAQGEVILETKDELTGGDAAKRETIAGIAVHKTTQTRNVFELLEANGIPTSYLRQHGETAIVCRECHMLPLELVIRRYAWGSMLKREPSIVSTPEAPYRFDTLVKEMFHKHSVVMPPLVPEPVQMEEGKARELYLRDGKWAEGVYTDPLIQVEDGRWLLYSAKDPVAGAQPLMETEALLSPVELEDLRERIMGPTFEVLERAWAAVDTVDGPVALVDMKIEVGRTMDNRIVVADVIDNDSWRIWPGTNPAAQLDKQCFREDHPLHEVAEKYELVAALTERFAA